METISVEQALAIPYVIPCANLRTNNAAREGTMKYVRDAMTAQESAAVSILFLPTSSMYFPNRILDVIPPKTYSPAATPASNAEPPKVSWTKSCMLMRIRKKFMEQHIRMVIAMRKSVVKILSAAMPSSIDRWYKRCSSPLRQIFV